MKLFFAIVALFFSLNVSAETKSFSLIPGQIIDLDAADSSNIDNEITLKISVQNPVGTSTAPIAQVVEEVSGFECQISRVLLNKSSFSAFTKTFEQEYLVKVLWSPGADQSSCTVAVQHASIKPAKAVIFMNWMGE